MRTHTWTRHTNKGLHAVIGIVFFFISLFSTHGANAEIIDRIVALINDDIITLSELNRSTEATLRGSSKTLTAGELNKVRSRVLDKLIEKLLMKQASIRAGVTVTERDIDEAIEDVKLQNGLSQEELLMALINSGLTYDEYRVQLREEIMQSRFVDGALRASVKLQDEDIEEFYRMNTEKFVGPAAYRLRLILIPNNIDKKIQDERLEAITADLASGMNFSDLAKTYSEGPASNEGGDLGFLDSGEMDTKIEAAAAKLKIDEISEPIETEIGTSIIQLIDKKEAGARPFEEVRDRAKQMLYRSLLDEKFQLWLENTKRLAHIEVRM